MTFYMWVFLLIIIIFNVSNQCEHGEVRLVGSSAPNEGRVEVCIVSQWGRVCSAKWDDDDATVVCRQLGYSPHDAATSGTEFGQGDGPILLNNVQCSPSINKVLLECDGTGSVPCDYDAGVKCTDEQRVKNISAHILKTSNTSTVHTVLVTWDQNLTVDEPTSFKVECRNDQYRIISTISNENSSTQLGGLLSFSYNCCVTAVYPMYEAKEICTGINTSSNTITLSTAYEISSIPIGNNLESNSTNLVSIVSGVLGFIMLVVLILLALSWIASLCLQQRKRFIPPSIPTQQNVSYSLVAVRESQTTISGTPTQVMRSTSAAESTNNHT